MPSWFGSGGVTVEEPSRTYPQRGTDVATVDLTGGARGPAAIPSRLVSPRLARPAPPDPRRGGPVGPRPQRRAPSVENAGAPRLLQTGELGHDDLPWARPAYPNIAGKLGYHAPTQMPSWSANAPVVPTLPRSPIPVSIKRIANFMVREEYGSTRQLFPGNSLAGFVAGIQRGIDVEGRSWRAKRKMKSPITDNLSVWGQAGSYGQTTTILPTSPANTPVAATPHGLY